MNIQAECHSDCRTVEIDFDATEWFEQASDHDIIGLAQCGWGGDYSADVVAEHFALTTTKDLFDYLALDPRPYGDTIGFECHVDESSARTWLTQHRAYLEAILTQADEDKIDLGKVGLTMEKPNFVS